MSCLQDVIASVEIYAHPANHGNWTMSIFSLIHATTSVLLRRWNEEQAEGSKIPIHRRISLERLQKVAQLFLPLLLQGIFAKDNQTLDLAQVSLKHLCWLVPDLAFPGIIPKIVPALETLTEAHRTCTALTTLCLLSPAMLRKDHYPAVRQHFVTFLHLALPGLDFNDSRKTFYTCLFYCHALMHVPIVDCSQLDSPMSVDGTPGMPDSVYAATVASTSGFGSWLEKLFLAIFSFYRALPENYNASSSSHQTSSSEDDSLLASIEAMASIVFMQLSDDLSDMALDLLIEHLKENVIPSAAESVGSLTLLVSPRDRRKKLDKLFGVCEEKIQCEIQVHGAGTIITQNSNLPYGYGRMSDSTLHWWQEILNGVLGRHQSAVLEIPGLADRIEGLLDLMVSNLVSQRGGELCATILLNYVRAFICPYPINLSSLGLREWKEGNVTIDDWGSPFDFRAARSSDIEWHQPCPEGIKIATKLVSKYLDLSTDALNRLMLQGAGRSYKETLRWIRLYQACMECTLWFLPPQFDQQEESEKSYSYRRYPVEPPLISSFGWLFRDSESKDFQYWKSKLAGSLEFLTRITEFFLLNEENQSDTESVNHLCILIEDLFVYDFRASSYLALVSQWSGFLRIRGKPSTVPRYMRICKLAYIQLTRIARSKRLEPLVPDMKKLALFLVDLSLSRFRKIRLVAQSSLKKIISVRPELEMPCLSKAAFALLTCPLLRGIGSAAASATAVAEEDDSTVKGALYIMASFVTYYSHAKYDPDFMFVCLKALMRWATAKIILEDNLMDLLISTMSNYINAFAFSGYEFCVPQEYNAALFNKSLADFSSGIVSKTKRVHVEMVEYLLSIKDDCHWKVTTTIVQLMHDLVAGGLPITAEMVTFAFECTLHDNASIRKHAIFLIYLMLKSLKMSSTAKGGHLVDSLGIRHRVKREEAEFETIKKDWFNWEIGSKEYFCDNLCYGYITWPLEIKIFKGSIPKGSGLTFSDPDAIPAMDMIVKYTLSSDYWRRFVQINSMEPEMDDDQVLPDLANVSFLSRLVVLVREDAVDVIAQQVEELIDQSDEPHCQKAAVEIIASIYCGSKFFPRESIETLDALLIPLITKAISNCTTESLYIWKFLFDTLYSYRDPRRFLSWILPYFSTIQETESTSFFSQSRQLTFLDSLMGSNRVSSAFAEQVMANLLKLKDSPYGEIRQMIGSLVEASLSHISLPVFATADDFFMDAWTSRNTKPIYIAHPLLASCFHYDASSSPMDIDSAEDAKSALINTSKTGTYYSSSLCALTLFFFRYSTSMV